MREGLANSTEGTLGLREWVVTIASAHGADAELAIRVDSAVLSVFFDDGAETVAITASPDITRLDRIAALRGIKPAAGATVGAVKICSMLSLREAARPQRLRVEYEDGLGTTVHLARYSRARTAVRVVAIRSPATLVGWCAANGVSDAIVGGFFIRAEGTPLGELRLAGALQRSQAFDAPWAETRACLHIDGEEIRCVPRDRLAAEPGGDLLQAGPMLVSGGVSALEVGADPEGFSAGAAQFDSDITLGRYPRAALGITSSELIALACDGRSDSDAGMSLAELAGTMAELGAEQAINLDGGGSASLVVAGELACVPREEHGRPLPGGRPISTAITFAAC